MSTQTDILEMKARAHALRVQADALGLSSEEGSALLYQSQMLYIRARELSEASAGSTTAPASTTSTKARAKPPAQVLAERSEKKRPSAKAVMRTAIDKLAAGGCLPAVTTPGAETRNTAATAGIPRLPSQGYVPWPLAAKALGLTSEQLQERVTWGRWPIRPTVQQGMPMLAVAEVRACEPLARDYVQWRKQRPGL